MKNCDRFSWKKPSLTIGLNLISVCLTLNNNCDSAQSQIVPDNTLGNENSQVRSNDEVRGLTTEIIEGGALRDSNLFHSFQEFNVNQNSSVYFANPEGIVNILGRVTGNNISNILGTLGVDGSANLFLLNPNGIVFGENASLDVNGSFAATSASAIEFGEQGFYSATDPESPPLLTVNPSAFLFNQINPGEIQSQSTASAGVDSNGNPILGLRVPDGNSLLFLGGEIAIDGGASQSGLHAINGQLELLGVNQQGTVGINADSANLALNFPQELELANISLNNGAFINTSGEAGGAIRIQGKNITLSDQSFVFADTLGNQDGSGVLIQAENLILDNASRVTTDVVGSGQAGNLNIETAQLSILNGSVISSSVFEQGNAGNINISTELLTLESTTEAGSTSRIASTVNNSAMGNSGDININTNSLFARNGSRIITDTSGIGDGGRVSIQAKEQVELSGNTAIFSNVNPIAQGNTGGVEINTVSLSLSDGAIISSSVLGQGNSGDINIDAENSVAIIGLGRPSPANESPPTSIFSIVGSEAMGNGSNISINTGSFSLANFVTISSSNSSLEAGNAGNVSITAQDDVLISGSGISTVRSSFDDNGNFFGAQGNAGNVSITANNIRTELDSFIDSSNRGNGNSGDILLQANSISLIDPFIRSEIFGSGQAGNLNIIAEDFLMLRGERTLEPTVTVETFGPSQGGNINLQGKSVSIEQGVVLNAVTQSEGNGGNIQINANQLKVMRSLIDASSVGTGNAGLITINADESLEVIGFGFSKLRETILDPALENPTLIQNLFAPQNISNINSRSAQGIVAITTGKGDAGDIEINTERLSILNGSLVGTASIREGATGSVNINASELLEIDQAIISASTLDLSEAGDIEINTGKLSITNGGQIVATTLRTGNAGDLKINATKSIELQGVFENANPSSILVGSQRVETGADGGNLKITTPKLTLADGAVITATTLGQGNGGNIDIQASEILLLRNNGLISTTAGSSGTGGDGGNINIDADFLVTAPLENSDIIANAFAGNGGNIDIQAQGVLGIEERQATEDNITNDIDASSEFGLSGVVEFDVPDIELSTETVKLTTQLTETKVAQVCEPGEFKGQNEFFVSGRSGFPDSPTTVLKGDLGWEDWQIGNLQFSPSKLGIINQNLDSNNSMRSPANNEQAKIIEAQSWIINEGGKVELIANSITKSSPDLWQKATKCHSN